MNKEYILFDLDGTLSDSAEGITKSVAYALEKYGFYEDYKSLGFFVGPPLKDVYRKKYGMTEEQSEDALMLFRERFERLGIFENSAYDGVEEMLDTLLQAGKKLVLATSKPEKYAKQIIERYGFTKYFYFIGGASMDESKRTTKEKVIEYCLEKMGNVSPQNCVMVGDREHDCKGAAKFGIRTVGVLYGYGSENELLEAGAVCLCKTTKELCRCLLGGENEKI